MKEEIREGNKVEMIIHPPKAKTLLRLVMRANSLQEAEKIIMEEYPNATIIHSELIEPLTQGKLFHP